MNWIASYFSISPALIKDYLSRFWAVSALSFIGYFFTGIFPVIISYNRSNNNMDFLLYLQSFLNNGNMLEMTMHCALPLVSAILVFRFLHNSGMTTTLHSLPLTRSKLFNSALLSGFILCVVPIVATGVFLMALRLVMRISINETAAYFNTSYAEVGDISIKLFSVSHIANWVFMSLILIGFVYTLCVLAAVVTANVPMHLFTSCFFNILLPVFFYVCSIYCQTFLFGYSTSAGFAELPVNLSPALSIPIDGGFISPGKAAIYIASILLICVISRMLYSMRPLERAGEPMAFRFMEHVMTWTIAFFGMSSLGFFFFAMWDGFSMFTLGFAVGAIVFFIIGRMIVMKSFRVFNVRTARALGVYALAAILFIGGIHIDFFGFEKRVPNPANLSAVNMSAYSYALDNSRLIADIDEYGYGINIKEYNFRDSENLESITAFHKDIIENADMLQNDYIWYYSGDLSLRYNPSKTFNLNRSYWLPYPFVSKNENLMAVFESDEFRQQNSAKELAENAFDIKIMNNFGNAIIPSSETDDLFAELEKDLNQQKFTDFISLDCPVYYMHVFLKEARAKDVSYVSVALPSHYKHVISWLENKGYLENIHPNADAIKSIKIVHSTGSFDSLNQKQVATITDDETILKLLEAGEVININNQDYWQAVIEYDTAKINSSVFQPGNTAFGQYAETETVEASRIGYIYFNEGNDMLDELMQMEVNQKGGM